MARAGVKWQSILGFTAAAFLSAAPFAVAQFTSFNDRSGSILEGNWQSCREADGQYGERIYDGTFPGFGPFELHMGPSSEFALFRGVADEHRAHTSSENLLRPYQVQMVAMNARHRWA